MTRQAHTMKGQRVEMAAQRSVMGEQLTTMQGQVAEMAEQTKVLKGSVEAANKNADAARQAVDIVISKERARIKVKEPKRPEKLSPGPGMTHVIFEVALEGVTLPTITHSGAIACLSDSTEPPDESQFSFVANIWNLNTISLENRVIESRVFLSPNFAITQPEIDGLYKGTKFIHFWGSIKYRDVFYDVIPKERVTSFRYFFGYSQLKALQGDEPFGVWVPCGPPEDNSQS